jgi:hypothetical protein
LWRDFGLTQGLSRYLIAGIIGTPNVAEGNNKSVAGGAYLTALGRILFSVFEFTVFTSLSWRFDGQDAGRIVAGPQ